MLNYFSITNIICALFIFCSCNANESGQETENTNNAIQIEYIDQYIIPFEYLFSNTTVGGLSAVEYAGNNKWYFIADDRSEYESARFYEAKINYGLQGFDTLIFEKAVYLKDRDNLPYKLNSIDPEAIRFNKFTNTLFYSSEGGRTESNSAPFIRETDTLGNFIKTYITPSQFNFYGGKGVRENGVFESLAFQNDSILWFSNELPLIEDGEAPQFEKTISPVRLSQLDVKNNQSLAQYAYMIEPVQARPIPIEEFNINSVVELLALDPRTLLVMERSFITGVGNYVKIFKVDLSTATDISGVDNLMSANYQAVKKELLIDFSDYNLRIDNIEGMTFGPDFEDGRKSLICVSDDNFSASQETQVWLFAIKGL